MGALPGALPVQLGMTYPIQFLLGDLPSSASWLTLPNTNTLRLAFLNATSSLTEQQPKGFTITMIGSLTEVFNLVNALDPYIRQVQTVSRNTIAAIDTSLTGVYSLVPLSLSELRLQGLPAEHSDFLYRVIGSDSPLYRVSSLATLLTLAACFLVHPKVT